MDLRGEKLGKEAEWFGFNDEQLRSWLEGVEGFNRFCKEVLGVTLQSYQKKMATKVLTSKRTALVLGRQSGKDFTISCLTIWLAITNKKEKLLLVSPAQRQSDMLYKRILTFVAEVPELYESVKRTTAEFTIFQNGSEIHSLPSTSYIRGYTEVTYVFVNEGAYAPDDVFGALMPMLAIKNGTMVIMGTPAGCQGYFWEAFNNPEWATIQLPSNVNSYITDAWVEEQKKSMRPEEFRTEIEAQFSETMSNFFPPKVVEACNKNYDYLEFPEPRHTYYCGVDWGRVHNSSVISILALNNQDKQLKIVNMIELKDMPFPVQIEEITRLHERWNFKKMTVEYAGLGIPPSEELKKRG